MNRKRYSSYKPSGVEWIGDVPEHWKVLTLKRLAKICNGQDQKTVSADDGAYPIYGTGGVFGRANKFLHTGPSVILGRKGTIDKPQYVEEPFWSVDTAYYTEIYDNTHPRYFFYLCTTIDFDRYKYGSAVPSMTQEALNSISFVVPGYQEQEAIAAYLDEKTILINNTISKKQRLIELLREERTALINQAVTRGLDYSVPLKSSGVEWLGKIPEHWGITRLKFVANVRSGFALNNSAAKENTVRLPYLRVANVQDGYLNLEQVTEANIEPEVAERYLLRSGDLLMNEGGDNDKLGRGCVWEAQIEPCLHQNHVFAVRMKEGVNPYWIDALTLCTYARQYFQIRAKQSTNLASISQSNLKELPILMPPPDEQENILKYINEAAEAIDRTIRKIRQEITLLQEYRTALINEVVTGKRCVIPQPEALATV